MLYLLPFAKKEKKKNERKKREKRLGSFLRTLVAVPSWSWNFPGC
jgi:hypothetical protein